MRLVSSSVNVEKLELRLEQIKDILNRVNSGETQDSIADYYETTRQQIIYIIKANKK